MQLAEAVGTNSVRTSEIGLENNYPVEVLWGRETDEFDGRERFWDGRRN